MIDKPEDKLVPERIEVWWDRNWKSRPVALTETALDKRFGELREHDSYGLAIEFAGRTYPGVPVLSVKSDPRWRKDTN